jgi:ABC-type nitrate/sulfonate/bicarbonate transport system substrate-binding protein
MNRKTVFTTLIAVLIIGLLLFPFAGSAAPPAQDGGQDYTVQADDWLSKLADKFYGDMFAYPAIVEATNSKAAEDDSYLVIANPDLIEVGQKLYIPSADEAAEVIETAAGDLTAPVTLRVGAKCGPTPHAMPLFAMLAQTGGTFDGVQIEYVPITEPPQMAALLSNADVDVVSGQIVNPAQMYIKGIRALRLWSLSMSKGFYVVAGEGVSGWEDLQGQRVLMPGPNSGPSFLGRASMRDAGFDPETDFTIEYMPASQIVQLMVAGEAPAAVTSEPHVTTIISKSKKEGPVPLKVAPMDLYSVFEAEAWPAGQLPLDGILTLQPVLDDEATRAALEKFVATYNQSIDFMLSNPAEASKLIAGQLAAQCDSKANPKMIENSLAGGRLQYDPRPVAEFLPELDAYIELILGSEVDEGYYAQP